MNKQQVQEFLKSVRQTQQKSKKMLQKVDKTLIDVRVTLKDIQQTNQNIDKFKLTYDQIFSSFAKNLSQIFETNPLKKKQGQIYDHLPCCVSVQETVQHMMKYDEILIITGAGISLDSGIPTFRGQDGLYNKKYTYNSKDYNPEQLLNIQMYNKNPKVVWNWLQNFHRLVEKSKPNKIHKIIHKLCLQISSIKNKKINLITQNIDDLHLKPQNKQYNFNTIHGNIKYVRCYNLHLIKYIYGIQNQLCQICGEKLRPHILFFDEKYGPLYGEQFINRNIPFVIVIGSSLQTGMCIKLVSSAKQVIQINPIPQIEVGKVMYFKQNTFDVLQKMLNVLQKR